MKKKLWLIYELLLMRYPFAILVGIISILIFFSINIKNFELDASADSLLLEGDKDLEYFRSVKKRFPASQDYLIIVYQPESELFSKQSLSQLAVLKQELLAVDAVTSVNSILDLPMLNHPDISLTSVSEYLQYLTFPDIDLAAAKQEFITSPLYKNLFVSEDGQTTALQVLLRTDMEYNDLVQQRYALRKLRDQGTITVAESETLSLVSNQIKRLIKQGREKHNQTVSEVRQVLVNHADGAHLFLGGLPMIITDMIAYIRGDLEFFSGIVLLFLVAILAIIFRQLLLVLLPLFCCVCVCILMISYLGWQQFPVTVISSNFIALLLIITMSMLIHLIVRFGELKENFLTEKLQHKTQTGILGRNDIKQLVAQTVQAMARPCLYTTLTTMVAFGSLLVSGIRPVIDFGIMMVIGLVFAYAIAFVMFPVCLLIFPLKVKLTNSTSHQSISLWFAKFTESAGKVWGIILVVIVLVCIYGISLLSVDNRFIDYFKKSTEIYQGMEEIDNHLGGTTPLDVLIETGFQEQKIDPADDEDCFIEDDCEEDGLENQVFFTPERVELFRKIHNFLDEQPETGKVLSIITTLELIEDINGAPLNGIELALIDAVFPEDLRQLLIAPFVNKQSGEVRFSLRLKEADPKINRQEILQKINQYLVTDLSLDVNTVHLTGMAVMYNNLLQTLFKSQILTIGVVFAAIFLMFIILFKSVYLAVIGLVPNVFAATLVLGSMGILQIPLDIMTITITAISVGIGVDQTIHYIYRYQREFNKDQDYIAAMYRAHGSIGKAMYYTSVTIIVGFSILVLSNFNPTIYFGFFTSIAMVAALLASLTLLPKLLVLCKPLGTK